jgi:Protein of unknown function (DUF1822)
MNTNKTDDISKLIETYPEHEWIDLSEYPQYTINNDTTEVDLNLQCKNIIKEWLETNRGLPSKEDLPYSGEPEHDRLVSQIVNGFCLRINDKSKVVFIPSEQIDIDSFEVAQEWVDLTNWMGDYYVPIQVDVDAQHLHLWGMITHQDLKQTEEPDDEMFRYYNIDADRMVDDLEVLWTSCELAPDPRSINIPELVTQGVKGFIDRVKSEAGSNFDRLILQFNEWGAILNDRVYLEQYLQAPALVAAVPSKSTPSLIVLRHWLVKQAVTIYEEWKSPEDFFQQAQWQTELRGDIDRVKQLTFCPEINVSFRDTHHSASRNINTNANIENLVSIIQNTDSPGERWKSIQFLWSLDSDHPALPTYKLIDLGLLFTGEDLSLLISIIQTKSQKLGISIRLNSNREGTSLPSGIKLSVLGEQAKIPREVITPDSKQQCLQLNFDADNNDLFSIRVTLGNKQLTEHFQV